MKDFIIATAILFVIFIPAAYAQQYDSQSANSRYNQNSLDNINSPYSPYESQYSPKNVNNPYSPSNVKYSPNNISSQNSQRKLQYSPRNVNSYPVNPVGSAAGAALGQRPKGIKGPLDASRATNLLDSTKSKNNISVFFYLLVLSLLAVAAVILIIIGVSKK